MTVDLLRNSLEQEFANIAAKKDNDGRHYALDRTGKLRLIYRPRTICQKLLECLTRFFTNKQQVLQKKMQAVVSEAEKYLSSETDNEKRKVFLETYSFAIEKLLFSLGKITHKPLFQLLNGKKELKKIIFDIPDSPWPVTAAAKFELITLDQNQAQAPKENFIPYIADLVAKKIFCNFTKEINKDPELNYFNFSIHEQSNKQLDVHYSYYGVKGKIQLSKVVENIAWRHLPKEWSKLTKKQIKEYNSIEFINLNRKYNFLYSYTGSGYVEMNRFMRELTCSHSDVNKINVYAQTYIFINLCTAAELQHKFSPLKKGTIIYRGANIDSKIIEKTYVVGKEMIERSLLSTTKASLKVFPGTVIYQIKTSDNSLAYDISSYNWSEQEVIFLPFTKFKVLNMNQTYNKYREYYNIELEEVSK